MEQVCTIPLTSTSRTVSKNTSKTITASALTGGKTRSRCSKFYYKLSAGLYFYSDESGNEYTAGSDIE